MAVRRGVRRGVAGLLLAACLPLAGCGVPAKYSASTFAMDTLVVQDAWGGGAQAAMRQVNEMLAAWEARLSLYGSGGDIAQVNAAAGGGVEVEPETAALLQQALALGKQGEGAFAITIAPLTLAWGVTSNTPQVPPQSKIDALLPLVNDEAVQIENNCVTLPATGMALDLGGIAKGAACAAAQKIYAQHGVNSALLTIGGNVYAHGAQPNGKAFRVGFADPTAPNRYIASFELENQVAAVSGGYERFFELDGKRYIHIIDPRTGHPAESDIVSVGVIHADGAEADFWSTTLFVWGRQKALDYLRGGGLAIILGSNGVLYVSKALQGCFELHEAGSYPVQFVGGEADAA